jgi:kynurenine formamidase
MIRRDVWGFGVETINTDAGQSYGGPVAHPCHTPMHGANKCGLQSGKVPGLAFNV